MSIEQYYVSQQLCWRCRRACGGCSWSQRLQPVPGWTATHMRRRTGHSRGGAVMMDTYSIKACPEFVPDRSAVNA